MRDFLTGLRKAWSGVCRRDRAAVIIDVRYRTDVEDVYGARRGLEKELPFRANGLGEISGAGLATSFYDGALLQWRKSGEELFRDLCSLKLTSGASLAGAGSSTSSFRSRSRSAAH